MDPHVRARTRIRTHNRFSCELPSQTWPSLKSFLTLYFFLELTQSVLYVQAKSIAIYSRHGFILITSYFLLFPFSFPFFSQVKPTQTQLPGVPTPYPYLTSYFFQWTHLTDPQEPLAPCKQLHHVGLGTSTS